MTRGTRNRYRSFGAASFPEIGPCVGVLLVCGGLGYGWFVPRLSVEQFHRQVEGDLPIGSPRKQVEEWLLSWTRVETPGVSQ